MSITALDLLHVFDTLPTTPLRAAILEALSKRPGIDTVELADFLGHGDPRKALTDLTKLRTSGLVLSREETPRRKVSGKPRMRWRLSVKGNMLLQRVEASLEAIQSQIE